MARESATERRKRAARIARALARAYPDARCALHYETPFQLLVATVLSAQCTDEMVNRVTAKLFPELGSPEALAAADPLAVEAIVRPTGFFRQKTKSIQAAARDIVEHFGGRVPDTMEELIRLRGVARKTANVVLGNAFGVPGLAVDTHMKRVNRRLGLTDQEDPTKIEQELMPLVPRAQWTLYTHRVIHHGRVCCSARRPQCEACPLCAECRFAEAGGREPGGGRAARRPRAGRAPSGEARAASRRPRRPLSGRRAR